MSPVAGFWTPLRTSGIGVAIVVALLSVIAWGELATHPAAANAEHERSVAAADVPNDLPTKAYTSMPRVTQDPKVKRGVVIRRVRPADAVKASALAFDGIPSVALQAYRTAARHDRAVDSRCGLTWPLLAAIGRVESDHGRFAGAVLDSEGVSTPRIIGIALDGHGTAMIRDTDHGRLDHDILYDRAVGPMQFIPSTWALYGADGNRDGRTDPFNLFDASAAAAHYLCVAGGDLTSLVGQVRAVRAYNESDSYLTLVLKLEGIYARGIPGLTVPVLASAGIPVTRRPIVPPANLGDPLTAAPKQVAASRPRPTSLGGTTTAAPSVPTRTSTNPPTSASTTSYPSTASSSTPSTIDAAPSPSPRPTS